MEKVVAQEVIDPLFLKSENEILTRFIEKELSKSGVDMKKESLTHLEKKKLVATIISALINLILIIVFKVFHYPTFFLLVLCLVNFIIWLKFTVSEMKDFFIKEIKMRPDESFSDIIAPQLYDRCKNQRGLRLFIYVGCTALIPLLMFWSSHIFYEDGPGGKYVRFYTEGFFSEDNVEIPQMIDGKFVVGIRGDVFKNTSIEFVKLPDNIDTIRGHAFENCENLQTINLPKKLKYIGGYCFAGCQNLNLIDIPESVGEIGGYCFADCKNLDKIVLPEGIKEIRGNCFAGSGIRKLSLPNSVERIGGHAFEGILLDTLIVPESVKSIGSSAFRDCKNLRLVIMSEDCDCSERAFKNSPVKIQYY